MAPSTWRNLPVALGGNITVGSISAHQSTVHVGNNVNITFHENIDHYLADLRLTDPRVDKISIEQRKGGLLHE
jgi:hypothetical protein